jgi:hypothetical protein
MSLLYSCCMHTFAVLCSKNAHALCCHLEIIKHCCTCNITFLYPPKYPLPSQVPGIGTVCSTCVSDAIEHSVLSARGCVEANRPICFPVNVHMDVASCAAPNVLLCISFICIRPVSATTVPAHTYASSLCFYDASDTLHVLIYNLYLLSPECQSFAHSSSALYLLPLCLLS